MGISSMRPPIGRCCVTTVAVLFASVTMAAPQGEQEGGHPHAEETIGTVEQIYDGALMPDEAVETFRNIDRLFRRARSKPVARCGNCRRRIDG